MERKKEVWDIFSVQRLRERVYFDKPVTQEEAINLFHDEEYEDIQDIEVLSLVDVTDAR